MTNTPEADPKIITIREMTVTITRGHNEEGEFVRVYATKGGRPFDDEDHFHLQILEYELMNTCGGQQLEVLQGG